ncbi:MAG: hypothetical protein ACI9QV_000386 [Methylophagaceae bacterium]|jgi:hypothetical protein
MVSAVNGYNRISRLAMTTLNKKSQELDARTIMEGLEEFATFASFNSSHSGMRVFSVETLQPTALPISHNRRLKTVSTSRPEHKPMAL